MPAAAVDQIANSVRAERGGAARSVAQLSDAGDSALVQRKAELAGVRAKGPGRQTGSFRYLAARRQSSLSRERMRRYERPAGVREHRLGSEGRFALSALGCR